ncbi:MAG TPA: hypothetical protein VGP76_01920 [Planctomycetaceae bacterium]|nr:hypothetical protein [Planctomycetaceae bacterium]
MSERAPPPWGPRSFRSAVFSNVTPEASPCLVFKPFFRPLRKRGISRSVGSRSNWVPIAHQAFEQYHALIAAHRSSSTCSTSAAAMLVVEILNAYLERCQIHNAPATYQ